MSDQVSSPINIYQKINKARVLINQSNLKKSGYNDFKKYPYFTLDDIIPAIVSVCESVGLCGVINMPPNGSATLRLYDTQNIEHAPVEFSVVGPAINPGKDTMQTVGASITYLRRYLWMMAMEICEDDLIDKFLGENTPPIGGTLGKGKNEGKSAVSSAQGGHGGVKGQQWNQPVNTAFPKTEIYTIPLGKFTGKKINELLTDDLLTQGKEIEAWVNSKPVNASNEKITDAFEYITNIDKELRARGVRQ